MSNVAELRVAVSETLAAVSGFVERASTVTWTPADGALPVVRSAIIRRQHECLTIAVELVDKSHGFAAVGLLRPACEEFLWAKYLATLPRADAERLIMLMARQEFRDSLKAQDEYAGRHAMEKLGLANYLKRSESSSKSNSLALKALGTKLGWAKQTVESCKLPSMSFIAKVVGETKLYKLLYHASSRYVHFSPAELMRRAWSRTGHMSISSAHFTDYWASFVLYGGVRLLVETFLAACTLDDPKEEDGSIEADRLMGAAQRIGEFGQIPIVTAEELEWETSGQ